MNEAFITNIASNATSILISVGLKLVGALLFWIIGRWLIKFAIGLLTRSLKNTTVDPTLVIYLKSTAGVLLNVVLVVAILGFFGIETTSFAALLAACRHHWPVDDHQSLLDQPIPCPMPKWRVE